jgi:imidazolonepropionase
MLAPYSRIILLYFEFSGDRVHEFAMKLEGATYMDIQRAGGGIIYTMNSVANSTEQELYNLLIPRLNRMLNLGTTLLEAKSGYGLDFEHEAKMLKVLHRANNDHVIDIVSTYLPAHAVVPVRHQP